VSPELRAILEVRDRGVGTCMQLTDWEWPERTTMEAELERERASELGERERR
jgi:hypothetical protein